MQALLSRPDQMEALKRDRGLLHSAVEEMLRWVSPIKNMSRTATSDIELHGETIKHGDTLAPVPVRKP